MKARFIIDIINHDQTIESATIFATEAINNSNLNVKIVDIDQDLHIGTVEIEAEDSIIYDYLISGCFARSKEDAEFYVVKE
jgi:hypothetical protein